ncbi:MAG TPA: iron-containing alcohol dehydrogenase, partial [Rugosimonospora sp.]|nr:iron-containing alcohol dehydrogenase [Rugosimonospora sp.]
MSQHTSFTYRANPARIVFGAGSLDRLPDELRRLGATRALLLSGSGTAGIVDRAAGRLGPLAAARFDGA